MESDMGIVRTRPEPGHITYGTKLVLINLTVGEVTEAKLNELIYRSFNLAREKSLCEVEIRFRENTDVLIDMMAPHSSFYAVHGTKGTWVSNVKP